VKAMILAAGRGERMRPLTDEMPKSLLRAGGKALIVWTIERLARAGMRDLVINHAHKGEMIEAALGDGAALSVRIRYSPEATALETAGGIANALALLGDEPFIAVAADVYSDYDFSCLCRLPERGLALAHLVLVPNPEHNAGGDFGLEGSRVLNEPRRFTFSGIGLYRPELFAGLRRGSSAKLAPLLRRAIEEDRVNGELHSGEWRDIGTPERLAALERDLAQG
jgi:MurNAc alpha-1-phosphate uridylyltransferase